MQLSGAIRALHHPRRWRLPLAHVALRQKRDLLPAYARPAFPLACPAGHFSGSVNMVISARTPRPLRGDRLQGRNEAARRGSTAPADMSADRVSGLHARSSSLSRKSVETLILRPCYALAQIRECYAGPQGQYHEFTEGGFPRHWFYALAGGYSARTSTGSLVSPPGGLVDQGVIADAFPAISPRPVKCVSQR